MAKKMKFLSLLKKNTNSFVKRSFPLPCQQQPRTLSFNALAITNNKINNDILKIFNSDPTSIEESPESIFTDQSLGQCASFSSISEINSGAEGGGGGEIVDHVQNMIRELHDSDRIFFDHDETRSIVKVKANSSNSNSEDKNLLPLLMKDSVAMSMDSNDPYVDFKNSMEEMVNAHSLKGNWEGLEELLYWYLKINGEHNHGYIVSSFVDIIVGIASSSSNSPSPTPCFSSSPMSFNSTFFQSSSSCSNTLCVSCIEGGGEEIEGHNLNQV